MTQFSFGESSDVLQFSCMLICTTRFQKCRLLEIDAVSKISFSKVMFVAAKPHYVHLANHDADTKIYIKVTYAS